INNQKLPERQLLIIMISWTDEFVCLCSLKTSVDDKDCFSVIHFSMASRDVVLTLGGVIETIACMK
ncbi:TPA: hypothetical protein ACH1J3_005015, partial [Citrobacter werkmanii]